MAKKIRIPTTIRKLADNQELIDVTGSNVGEAITELHQRFPAIKERILDEKGNIVKFIAVYLNDEDIRFLKNQQTPIKDGDVISLLPAISGG